MNKGLVELNKERKERYQRTIKDITKSEYIIFIALLIEASINKMQGCKLWKDDRGEKKMGLAPKIDFGIYMKYWRFAEVKRLIPYVMEDDTLKGNGDVWWKFKGRVDTFNKIRKDVLFASSIRVFDESMSPYMPR